MSESERHGVGLVEFDRVWKRFRRGEVHDSLRDLLPAIVRGALGGALGRGGASSDGTFWALGDVSFTVRPGEALGIIGSNGAGKSTILKVLTGILEPTYGRREVTGRVGSLIELEAAFHGDLTGRENVFLQGAFMGMHRREIARKFDEIVAFSGVEEFIDMPVKRYSSGMNARLGFAVAAHLEPDVLIIDEVLSVGDAAFQRKAFARVKELVQRDTPVVVVSHQLDQLAALCTHALVLDRGRVVTRGAPAQCVTAYLESSFASSPARSDAAIEIETLNCWAGATVGSGGRLLLSVQCRVHDASRAERETVAIRLRAPDGSIVFSVNPRPLGADTPRASSWYWMEVSVRLNVPPNAYVFEALVWDDVAWRETAGGPSLGVTVTPGAPTADAAHPDARAWISYAEEHGEATGWRAPAAAAAEAALEAEEAAR